MLRVLVVLGLNATLKLIRPSSSSSSSSTCSRHIFLPLSTNRGLFFQMCSLVCLHPCHHMQLAVSTKMEDTKYQIEQALMIITASIQYMVFHKNGTLFLSFITQSNSDQLKWNFYQLQLKKYLFKIFQQSSDVSWIFFASRDVTLTS